MNLNKTVSQKSSTRRDLSATDIVDLIVEDHQVLKECIRIMKDVENSREDRQSAAETFAVQLVAHSKPEETVLYEAMKKSKELALEAFEGETEHMLADQLLEEIKRASDETAWSAKVKVIAEIAEHHIKEEENDILPEVKKMFAQDQREVMGRSFLEEKSKMLELGGDDAPPEKSIH